MFESCWLWKGSLNAYGRGRMWQHGRLEYVHRVAYISAYGPIPKGKQVNHVCNQPACINPAHLYAGTHYDNWVDAKANGWQPAKGEQAGKTKLSKQEVKEIRKRRFGTRTLAKKYHVNRSTIQNILRGSSWR